VSLGGGLGEFEEGAEKGRVGEGIYRLTVRDAILVRGAEHDEAYRVICDVAHTTRLDPGLPAVQSSE
jgi:hypothetical protein